MSQPLSTADVLGDGFLFQFEGKVYRFAPKDQIEVVGLYEAYLEECAWRALDRASQWLAPQQLQEQADGIRRDVVTGVYGYGSRYWLESLRSMQHQKKLAVLMAQYHDRDFDPAVIDRIYRDPVRLRELVAKMFGLDPNDLTPRMPPAAA